MKTVAVILVILLVVVAAILILAAMKPATFRITRATSIKASPEKIFPLIADFHRLERLVALGEDGSGAEADL